MRKFAVFLFFVFLVGCAYQSDTAQITPTILVSDPTKNAIQPTQAINSDAFTSATRITSVQSVLFLTRWMSSGKILCRGCNLPGSSGSIEWGIIDPLSDTFLDISNLEYYFTPKELEVVKKNNNKIYDFLFSPSGNKVIIETRELTNLPILHNRTNEYYYHLYLLSRIDGKIINVPMNIEFCSPPSIAELVQWSEDEIFLLGECRKITGGGRTSILLNLNTSTIFDLRELVNSEEAVSAALSPDGRKIAITNSEQFLWLFEMDDQENIHFITKFYVGMVDHLEWSNDNISLYFSTQESITDLQSRELRKINTITFESNTILDYSSIKEIIPKNQFGPYGYFSGIWSISPNNDRLWITNNTNLWILANE